MMVSTWDLSLAGTFRYRRRLTPIKLIRKLWTTFGKAVGLVWQVFLLVGPDP